MVVNRKPDKVGFSVGVSRLFATETDFLSWVFGCPKTNETAKPTRFFRSISNIVPYAINA